ncbi:MAG: site-2 protease family protein, partial [Planctomycetes bacterium]|nr:site-2 protease family protein [Planctomycetota bacterium]
MAFGSILLAAIGIGMLIFLHELGHFLAARLAGVRVEVFSLGYGPRLCGVVWRGTDFRLSAVPFGGYVMVAGADPGDRRYPAAESLWAKSIGHRALFWSGGVLMNVVLALVLFPIAFRAGVDFTAPIIGRVEVGSAAWEARLQPGDRVVAIGQKLVYSGDNLLVEIALTGGRPTTLTVRAPDGAERKVTVEPQWNGNDGRYELGIEPAVVDGPMPIVVKGGGPAEKAGLQSGDLLLLVDGAAVRPQIADPG